MKPWKKRLLIAASAVLILICILCCVYIYQYFRGAALNRSFRELAAVPAETPATEPSPEPEPKPSPAAPEEASAEPEIPTMAAVFDFDALQAINSEIYAYLEIPGTTISYPVVQSAEDNLYYNTHAADRSYYSGGSIYSQNYNAKDFSDPNTVLYGHNLRSGDMFGLLGNYTDVDFFREHPTIYIHMPERICEYRVFAAYPYSNEHLLLNHDFGNAEEFDGFFDAILENYALIGNFDEEFWPAAGDSVLTLSTCYGGNRSMRFLVQAVQVAAYAVEEAP